jgi:hypothetical protein
VLNAKILLNLTNINFSLKLNSVLGVKFLFNSVFLNVTRVLNIRFFKENFIKIIFSLIIHHGKLFFESFKKCFGFHFLLTNFLTREKESEV